MPDVAPPQDETRAAPSGYNDRNLTELQVETNCEDTRRRIISFHDILSDTETEVITKLAHPRMMQASVGHGKEVSEGRISRNCWIKDFESALVDKISARVKL